MEVTGPETPRRAGTITGRVFTLIVCYDIADDGRRADVSTLLTTLGPRVQLSVFECKVAGRRELQDLLARIGDLIEPVEDQVRVYNLGSRQASPTVLGQRMIEEWRDFMIL